MILLDSTKSKKNLFSAMKKNIRIALLEITIVALQIYHELSLDLLFDLTINRTLLKCFCFQGSATLLKHNHYVTS